MKKITPFLWFNGNAEEAMNFYASIFDGTKVGKIERYGDGAPFPKGTAMTASFELLGQKFVALNGGPQYEFTPAISFAIDCETQAEVDHYWSKLTDGGKEQPCGWLVDKFGLSWQVVPVQLVRLLSDPDPKKAGRVAQAMFKMTKIDIATLERAAAG
jgi:predicted 3-demethylubiquinone-9 3-methyltransferase (glyoxalase superfamily)